MNLDTTLSVREQGARSGHARQANSSSSVEADLKGTQQLQLEQIAPGHVVQPQLTSSVNV